MAKIASVCERCRFADWKKTATGRLHPDKSGRCTFEWVPPPLPASFYWSGFSALRPSGGFIERGGSIHECPTFEARP